MRLGKSKSHLIASVLARQLNGFLMVLSPTEMLQGTVRRSRGEYPTKGPIELLITQGRLNYKARDLLKTERKLAKAKNRVVQYPLVKVRNAG